MGLSLEDVADSFCRGFCYTKSVTHPYEYHRYRELRIMRDAPRKSGDYRKEEVVVVGLSPDEACEQLRELKLGRFFVCPIDPFGADYEGTKEAYKRNHFRKLGSEPMFVRATRDVPRSESPFPISRVTTPEGAEQVRLAAGSRQIVPADLHGGEANLRLYAAFDGIRPVAWVKSIRTGPDSAWVSNLHVNSEHRRKGLGRAIMAEMLVDDHAYGIEWSVLAASSVGAKLYDSIGYEEVGFMQILAPVKERWGIQPYR